MFVCVCVFIMFFSPVIFLYDSHSICVSAVLIVLRVFFFSLCLFMLRYQFCSEMKFI